MEITAAPDAGIFSRHFSPALDCSPNHGLRPHESRTTRPDGRHRASPSFRAKSKNPEIFSVNDDRKTLQQRTQMTDIERLRHSAAHVLATAILKIWPEAQFAAGPPVENGFYYDLELDHRISPEDFEKIEAEMKKEIKANHVFERIVVPRDEALSMAQRGVLGALGERSSPSKFKLDIIQNILQGEEISLYHNEDFTDLRAVPHVLRTGNVAS